MVLLFVVGSQPWFLEEDVLSTQPGVEGAMQRLFVFNSTARWCCAVVAGELLLWDIPCALLVPSLQDALM